MSEEYQRMWCDLGLDLAAHDVLLEVLCRADYPEATEYFNCVMWEVHGLRVKEIMEGKKNGLKVIGSLFVFVPEESVRVADGTLVGLCTGANFAT